MRLSVLCRRGDGPYRQSGVMRIFFWRERDDLPDEGAYSDNMDHLEPSGGTGNVVSVRMPTGTPAPVVFDSPHSGTVRPADFDTVVPLDVLRRSEDMFVDELFATVLRTSA